MLPQAVTKPLHAALGMMPKKLLSPHFGALRSGVVHGTLIVSKGLNPLKDFAL